MKKMILFLMLIVASATYCQTTDITSLGVSVGNGLSFYDSLSYTTQAIASDSVLIIKWNYHFALPQLYLDGNTNTTKDSLQLRTGIIVYNARGTTAVDTIWGVVTPLKDSTDTVVSLAINNTTGTDYLILKNAFQILEIKLLNHRLTLPTRKVRIGIGAMKQ